ncbi:OsmC family protein [Spongisporangium articulatum]|uniref:OsmC family protein n=1 Tax=Spongisporangium articulatum TaxID=3362603 RepID=A0ABW8AL33_9ACTN
MAEHTYSTHLVWQGSTGEGYRAYRREHRAVAPPAGTTVALSADRAFRGDPAFLNPEQLLVMAASSCQLLAFLAVAARAGVDVLDYEDEASGFIDDGSPPARISTITLAPVIRVAPGTDPAVVHKLVEQAHEECYIANSLNSEVTVEATVL